MNHTAEKWYDREIIKALVLRARDDGHIKHSLISEFKQAARGKEQIPTWGAASYQGVQLFSILHIARKTELNLVWLSRDVPIDFLNRPEFFENSGSRHSELVWALGIDRETATPSEAIDRILGESKS